MWLVIPRTISLLCLLYVVDLWKMGKVHYRQYHASLRKDRCRTAACTLKRPDAASWQCASLHGHKGSLSHHCQQTWCASCSRWVWWTYPPASPLVPEPSQPTDPHPTRSLGVGQNIPVGNRFGQDIFGQPCSCTPIQAPRLSTANHLQAESLCKGRIHLLNHSPSFSSMRNSNQPALPVAPCIASNSLRRFPAWPDWSPKMPFCTCSFTNIIAWCCGQPGHGTDLISAAFRTPCWDTRPVYQCCPMLSFPYSKLQRSIDPTPHLLNRGAAGAAIQSIHASNLWTARRGTFLGSPGFPAQRPTGSESL